jgi:glucosylceramidase
MAGKALSEMPENKQNELMSALFEKEGCNFNFCRLPIGASDYAMSWYSYNEHPGDFAMEKFSIERDREYLLPYVKKALKLRPDLIFFASPWSPPTWMKTPQRYNGGTLIDDPAIRDAHALYFLKYLRAYREEGIDIEQIHIQNEPDSDQKFPSCQWTGAEMRDYIRDHLGPLFEREEERCEIWAGTIERGVQNPGNPWNWKSHRYRSWAHTILTDPGARNYVKGIGYQWDGKGAVAQTHANFPDIRIMQTENECGDGQNTWEHCFYVFDLIWHYLRNGVEAYMYWNLCNYPHSPSTWGWRQNAMIGLDPDSGTVSWHPEFYLMKHLSHAVQPGARFVPLTGDHAAFSLYFINPDDTQALVLANPSEETASLDQQLPGLEGSIHVEPMSLNTLTW